MAVLIIFATELVKLKLSQKYNVCGNLLSLISTWLHTKSQRVVLNGSASGYTWSNIVQGSILGVVIALIMLDDIEGAIKHSRVIKYSDENKIYRPIQNIEDCMKFQSDIDNIGTWPGTWGIVLNVSKCSIMKFGNVHQVYRYTLNGLELQDSACMKDVGCYISSNFDQTINISTCTAKARSNIYLLSNSIVSKDRNV